MSNTNRPAQRPAQRPAATFPPADHLARLEHVEAAHRERLAGPFDGWRDATPTELLPVVGSTATPSRRERTASTAAGTAFPRVSTLPEPTAGLEARRTAPTRTKGLRRLSRHLRAALAGIALAAVVLTGLQLYAAAGITSARQAALSERDATPTSASTMSGHISAPPSVMSGQMDAQPDWVTENTGAAYDRTNPAASPLDLPRCTTSPSTPLPCLATISPSQGRAVVLEEDASLTAVVRR